MRPGHLSEIDLTEYTDGELAGQRLAGVEAHLQQCPLCSGSVARLREVAAAAGHLARHRAPSEVRRRASAVLADPSLRISCRQAAVMMHEHLDRRLSLLAAVPLELHLGACQGCRTELAALTSATRSVRGLPGVEAPARVREQVMTAYRQRAPHAMGAPRWLPALAVASAALVIGLATLIKPSVSPPKHQVVAQRAEQPVRPEREPVTIAAAVPARSEADTGESAALEPGPVVIEVAREQAADRLSSRPAILRSKGPKPEAAAPEAESPRVALPAALRALRAVARSASTDWEVQRAMETAGERFATIGSEAMSKSMLASLPGAVGGDGGGDREIGGEGPAPKSGDALPPQDGGGGQPNHPPAPVREGASLKAGPFV